MPPVAESKNGTPAVQDAKTVSVLPEGEYDRLAELFRIDDPYSEREIDITGVLPSERKAASKQPPAGAAAAPAPESKAAGIPPAPPAPPAPPKHPAWLSARAAELKLSPTLVERLDTESLSEIVVTALANTPAGGRADATQPPAAASPPAAAHQPPPEPEFDWGVHEDVDVATGAVVKRQIQESDLHPAITTQIKRLSKENAELKKGLDAILQKAQQGEQQTKQSQVEQEFDRVFNLAPALFGQGNAAAVKGTPQYDRRATVYQAVKNLYASLPEAARAGMTIEAAVKTVTQAMSSMWGQQSPPPQPRQQSGRQQTPPPVPPNDVSVWNEAAVAAPTSRQPNQAPPGRQRAAEGVSEWWKTHAEDVGDTAIDEFL